MNKPIRLALTLAALGAVLATFDRGGQAAPVQDSSVAIDTPATRVAATPFDLASTSIDWHVGLDAARGQGRPILLFQLLGHFDEVEC